MQILPQKPVPFWSWNDDLEAGELARQTALISAAGWGGAFVHARVGLLTPYLGPQWFAAVDATINACRQNDLQVWLYDEDKWPSGFSGGTVPLAGPECRMRVLLARREGVPVPPGCEMIRCAGELNVYEWIAPLVNPWFNGTSYSDTMGEAGTRRFMQDAYQRYADRYSEHYGSLIFAQFTDEPASIFRLGLPRGAVPWSVDLPKRFQVMHGYDPVPFLHLLFDSDEQALPFRLHYFQTVNQLFEQNFVRRLGNFCDAHGIALTGHFMSEHSLYDQQLWGTKVMPLYRHQHLPGIDHLGRQVNEVLAALQCRSVANQYGKRDVLSELFGVSGQGLSFEDRWWIASQQIALGVTLLNPHLSLYTMAGCRKRDYPPNLFYQQPWWPLNDVLDRRLSLLCGHMRQGRFSAEVLVLHPQESAWALWQSDPAPDAAADDACNDHQPTAPGIREAIACLNASLDAAVRTLLQGQIAFDLGDETILAEDAAIAGDRLEVGLMRYRVVIIPPMLTIRQTTLTLLEEFIASGGTVLCLGEPPALLDGQPSIVPSAVLAQTVVVQDLVGVVSAIVQPAMELRGLPAEVCSRVLSHPRDLPDGRRLLMIVNLHRTEGGLARVYIPGPWTNAIEVNLQAEDDTSLSPSARRSAEGIELSLCLEPTRVRLLYLSSDKPQAASAPVMQSEPKIISPDQWHVTRLDENALTLDTAQWREGDAEFSDHAVPVLAVQRRLDALKYNGPLTLRHTFSVTSSALRQPMRLVVEHPERWEITINGTPRHYAGLRCWRDIRWMSIDITGLIKGGNNVIELHASGFQPGDLTARDPTQRYGTEAEAVYLVGDFSVRGEVRQVWPQCPRWQEFQLPPVVQHHASKFVVDAPTPLRAGDVTPQGLPFYAGRVRLEAQLAESPARRLLSIARLDAAVAEVRFAGQTVGHFVSSPLEVTLPPGGGELTITLYGTLRNLLGPHHHPEGELPVVSPPLFEPDWSADPLSAPVAVQRWGRGVHLPARWDEGYSLVSLGNMGEVTLAEINP